MSVALATAPDTRSDSDLELYVYEELRSGKSVVVEAYPGFGKTRLGSRVLGMFDRGVMSVRTHEEVSEVFGFLGSAKGVAYAYGKPKVCFRTGSFSYGFCRAMLMFGRCGSSVDSRDVAWLAAAFRTPEEVRREATRRRRCLYFAMRVLAHSGRRLVTTYDYIVSNPEILRGRDVAIFDEAQTLLGYVEEAVVVVNEGFVGFVSRALKSSAETRVLAYAVRAAYRRASGLHDFVENLEAVLSSAPRVEHQAASYAVGLLESVLDAYRRRWYASEGRTYYFMTSTLPSLARFSPKLMLGAYLPPPFVSTSNVVLRIRGEPRVEAVVDTDLSSEYELRGVETYAGYARKVAEYARGDVGNLAVFPSHSFMEEVVSRLGDSVRHRVIREPVGGAVPPGYILVDVAGGRYTEGVNLAGLGCVIACGLPYPEPDPVLGLLSRVYDCDMYTYVAMSRLVQAVGRIRGRGVAYIVDRRAAKHLDKLPPWISLASSPP